MFATSRTRITTTRSKLSSSYRPMFALLHAQAQPFKPTFHNQSSLPRLPIPPLRQTLDRYIRSLEPLLKDAARRGLLDYDRALAEQRKYALDFEQTLGEQCQQRLRELDKNSPSNWLDDNFWLRKAYLEWRAPLLVNSNWWLALQDDQSVPIEVRQGSEQNANIWQMRRAAWIASRLLLFKTRLEREEIPPDLIRTTPLCMSHYTRMFNSCRIPKLECDELHQNNSARNILLLINNHCYSIDAYSDSAPASPNLLLERIQACAQDSLSRPTALPIPILTSDNRDIWAKNRQHLIALSPTNAHNLATIDSSLFALSLDPTAKQPYPSTIVTNAQFDSQLHNTAYGCRGENRWYDKTISMSVEANTRLGMMGEHSPCDALIPSILGDFTVGEHIDMAQFQDVPVSTGGWSYLEWDVDDHIKAECHRVAEQAAVIIADSDDSVLWFKEFGVEYIRKQIRLAPDAFIQMALQLAWFKLQGTITPVYETASTRMFLHGRTDVIRSLSNESVAFVHAMMDPSVKIPHKHDRLVAATRHHTNLTRDASTGQGIDRHILGLRSVLKPDEKAELFDNKMFWSCQEWKLSTSGLSEGDRFIGTGFGSPFPDGYGINYMAGKSILKFGIESKHSCTTTSTEAFKLALVDSLTAMREVCDAAILEQELAIQEQEQARL